jgi:hypothetical protein
MAMPSARPTCRIRLVPSSTDRSIHVAQIGLFRLQGAQGSSIYGKFASQSRRRNVSSGSVYHLHSSGHPPRPAPTPSDFLLPCPPTSLPPPEPPIERAAHAAPASTEHMRADHRRAHAAAPEQLLDHPGVVSPFEQVHRERWIRHTTQRTEAPGRIARRRQAVRCVPSPTRSTSGADG